MVSVMALLLPEVHQYVTYPASRPSWPVGRPAYQRARPMTG